MIQQTDVYVAGRPAGGARPRKWLSLTGRGRPKNQRAGPWKQDKYFKHMHLMALYKLDYYYYYYYLTADDQHTASQLKDS